MKERTGNRTLSFIGIRIEARVLLVVLLLVVSVTAAYWRVTTHEFITFDDNHYVYENGMVKLGLTWDSIFLAFTSGIAANWHPLTWISHMVDYELYGLNPGGHHATNLLFHLVNTVLLLLVFRRLTGDFWPSAFVAAFFGLHPLHVESVAWVAERKDVLSAMLWILTMFAYIRYVEKPGTKRYLTVVGVFALGLMSKPMLVTLPFVFLLLDFWPLRRFRIRENSGSVTPANSGISVVALLKEKFPLFVLSAVSSVVTFTVQRDWGAFYPLERMPFILRLGNAIISYGEYIRKMFWPSDLAVFYPHPIDTISTAGVLISLVCILAVTTYFTLLYRTRPYLIVGWLWYLGTLVPVIGIIQVGLQGMADRYMYIPMIGLSIIIAWGVPGIFRVWKARTSVLTAASALLFVTLMVLTWVQVGHWRTTRTLFTHTAAVAPGNYRALTILGLEEVKDGRLDEALAYYNEALKIIPTLWDVHNYTGIALAKQGKMEEAIPHYAEAVRIKPDYDEALFNMGLALDRLGRTEESIVPFSEALRLRPEDAEAHNTLGAALGKLGRMDEAIEHFREAVRIRPEYTSAHYNLGFALAGQGKYADAITHYAEVVRLKPDHVNAHYNLGLALEKVGRFSDAYVQFEQTAALDETHLQARLAMMRMNAVRSKLQREQSRE